MSVRPHVRSGYLTVEGPQLTAVCYLGFSALVAQLKVYDMHILLPFFCVSTKAKSMSY